MGWHWGPTGGGGGERDGEGGEGGGGGERDGGGAGGGDEGLPVAEIEGPTVSEEEVD